MEKVKGDIISTHKEILQLLPNYHNKDIQGTIEFMKKDIPLEFLKNWLENNNWMLNRIKNKECVKNFIT